MSLSDAEGPIGGSLLYDQPVSGTATISRVRRPRRGLKSAKLLVDGAQHAEPGPMRLRRTIRRDRSVPTKGLIEIPLDTTLLADGDHRVELVLSDVAGNTTVLGPYAVSVRNQRM